jgi:hypothetical protein
VAALRARRRRGRRRTCVGAGPLDGDRYTDPVNLLVPFLPAHVPNVMNYGGVWYRPPLVNIWSRSGGNHAVLDGAHVTTETTGAEQEKCCHKLGHRSSYNEGVGFEPSPPSRSRGPAALSTRWAPPAIFAWTRLGASWLPSTSPTPARHGMRHVQFLTNPATITTSWRQIGITSAV